MFSSSSSLKSSPAPFLADPPYWQKNLLVLCGAGLLSSSYLYNSNNEGHISRCDTKAQIEEQTAPEDDAESVLLSSTKTMAAAVTSPEPNEEEQEDEETHCTICLINRQGPCRPYWRKFERCMKDSSRASDSTKGNDGSNDEDGSADDTPPPTMGETCDVHMMPWLTCIQSHRNTYTLISNRFFQNEFVDGVEKGIHDEDKVCLGGSDYIGDGSLPSVDWRQLVEFPDYEWLKEDGGDDTYKVERKGLGDAEHCVGGENDADANLVEGLARINLWDEDGKGQNKRRRVDLAYVRDQDGLLLGHERFAAPKSDTEEIKSGTPEEGGSANDEMNNEQRENSNTEPTVGNCVFHVCPETTKAIQIFALYGKAYDEFGGISSNDDEEMKNSEMENTSLETPSENEDKNRGKQTLYYSGLISLRDLKPPSRIKDASKEIAEKGEK